MRRRGFDLVLIALTLVGVVLAVRTGRERSRLGAEYARLASKAGDLPVSDRTKVHVLALDTGEPLNFAWRVYLPAGYRAVVRQGRDGGQGSFWSGGAQELIARVRFRENDDGQVEIYTRFAGGSSRSGIGSKELADVLRGRWDRIRVEQLGADGLVAFGPDRSATLLKLTLPDDLAAEARATTPDYIQKQYVPVLLELSLGPDRPGQP